MALLHAFTAFASKRAVLSDVSLATNVALSWLPRIPSLDSIPNYIKGARYVFFAHHSYESVPSGEGWTCGPLSITLQVTPWMVACINCSAAVLASGASKTT